jgi:hypothetical protein
MFLTSPFIDQAIALTENRADFGQGQNPLSKFSNSHARRPWAVIYEWVAIS